MGTNKPPHQGQGSGLIPFMLQLTPNCVDIVLSVPKGTLTTLKCIYKVKKSFYIYSTRNFLSYLIWDIINTPPCRHNIILVSHGIARPNRKTPPTEPNKSPISGLGIDSNIFSITIHTQQCRYYLLQAQKGPHGFKTYLHS